MNDVRTEERLRSALHAEAGTVQPDDLDSLDNIRRRSHAVRTRRRIMVTGAGVAAVVVAAVTLAALPEDSTDVDTTPATDPTPTTETVPTTTETAPTTAPTPTTAPAPTSVPNAVWPPATGEQFTDPESAARSFVTNYLGIRGMVRYEDGSVLDAPIGTFRAQGDDAGEIDVHTVDENGRVRSDIVRSTLSLRRAGDYWGVMSAQSDSIVVDNPTPLGAVADPAIVDGRGRGFEALIIVTVRGEGMGAGEELARGSTMAGCCEELEPFHIELPVDAPGGSAGSILVQNDNPAGFGVPDFTVVPVHFVAGTGSQGSDESSVSVFWVDANGEPSAVDRTVRTSQGVLRGAIQQLLFGPTSAERDAGLSSGLSNEAASATFDVVLRDGAAVIEFGQDLPLLSPNTSTSAASLAFLRQLHALVFQFPTVDTVEYRIGGSCEAFWAWLQGSCRVVTRDDPGF
jgi:hypothetical protein